MSVFNSEFFLRKVKFQHDISSNNTYSYSFCSRVIFCKIKVL